MDLLPIFFAAAAAAAAATTTTTIDWFLDHKCLRSCKLKELAMLRGRMNVELRWIKLGCNIAQTGGDAYLPSLELKH